MIDAESGAASTRHREPEPIHQSPYTRALCGAGAFRAGRSAESFEGMPARRDGFIREAIE